MALMQIKSSNPNLSFILKKNPSSGMMIVEHKSGHLFGWYSPSLTEYNVYFKDKLQANSYGDSDFNNTLQYSSPLFVLDSINQFFNENIKKLNDKDLEGFENSVTVNLSAYANQKILNNFISQFPDYQFAVEDIANCKKITITTKKTINELMNLTAVLFALFELRKTDLFVDASLLTKYLHCLNRINAPYFVRYLFKMYLLRNYRDFTECQDILENNKQFQLTFGDNYLSRVRATEAVLDLSLPIVDIGCGEGKFLNFLAPKVPQYLGIDKDLEVLKMAEHKVKKHELTNVELFSDNKAFQEKVLSIPKVNGILIEVIEHMPLESAKGLMKEVMQYPNLETLVITTPDRDFNKHYLISGFRHDDHHYELTMAEFQELIKSVTPVHFSVEFINIGDMIDGVSTTVGAVLRRKSS